jgi:hypothetical protein
MNPKTLFLIAVKFASKIVIFKTTKSIFVHPNSIIIFNLNQLTRLFFFTQILKTSRCAKI